MLTDTGKRLMSKPQAALGNKVSGHTGRHKAVLGAVTVMCIGVVAIVHWQQQYDRSEMHKGVLRDKERIERRKTLKGAPVDEKG
jgi:hypothetical protein